MKTIFDKLFGKKKSSMEISITRGQGIPDELKELLSRLGDSQPEETLNPLFVLKDHPEVKQILDHWNVQHDANHDKLEALRKEFKERAMFLKKEHDDIHDRKWAEIHKVMKAKNLWPEGYKENAETENLSIRDGVMYHVKVKV